VSLYGWGSLTHSTTSWDCGVNHNHMRVFVWIKWAAARLCIRTRPLLCIRIIYSCVILMPPVARILSFFNVIIVSEQNIIILYWGYLVSSDVSL
jgi:hypothetical protein